LVSGNKREALQAYCAALQALPEDSTTAKDFELREKIINLVANMDPAPAIPDAAESDLDHAEGIAKTANEAGEWESASKWYEKALQLAPWVATAYYNRGLLEERLNRYGSAIRSFRLYLATAPPDHSAVSQRIVELEQKEKEASSHLIVPGKRIGMVTLGMTPAQLLQVLGEPDRSQSYGSNGSGYGYHDDYYIMTGKAGRVWSISTRSPLFATKEGLRVGDSQLVMEAKLGLAEGKSGVYPTPGALCKYYYVGHSMEVHIENGRVSEVFVLRPDYW
jgi:tetratricopeptide (TPR) repeat protein